MQYASSVPTPFALQSLLPLEEPSVCFDVQAYVHAHSFTQVPQLHTHKWRPHFRACVVTNEPRFTEEGDGQEVTQL